MSSFERDPIPMDCEKTTRSCTQKDWCLKIYVWTMGLEVFFSR